MQDRIVVDFDALNRIAARLQTASRELDTAAGSLGGLSLTRDAGAEQRLGNASRSLRTVDTAVGAGTVAAAIRSCKSALGQVGDYGERLSAAVRNISSLFETTESSLIGRELHVGDDPFSKTESDSHIGGVIAGSSGNGGGGGSGAALENSDKTIGIPHLKGDDAVFKGNVSGRGGGWINADGAASWDALGYSYDVSPTSVSAKGHLAQGKVSGSIFGGIVGGSLAVVAGELAASGKVDATLYKDGKLQPNIRAEAKAEATALSGEAKATLGSDVNNLHAKADGKVLTAEAKAGAKAGIYTTKDANGNEITVAGVKAEAGAEAYVASGKVSGGFSIFGIKVDASLKGHVGAGATVGGEVSSSHANLDFGAALGLGAGVSIGIDWSNFKIGW